MRKLLPTALLSIAGTSAIGLIAMSSPVVSAGADEAAKREDDIPALVLVADDDDDDTHDDDTDDDTASNFTGVSRDRDISRGDKTRDWTRDGGDRTRDWSANQTNDKSRNDTRARR